MRKHKFFLLLTLLTCFPFWSSLAQQAASSETKSPALGDNYTVPESYYNSINVTPPKQEITAKPEQAQTQILQQPAADTQQPIDLPKDQQPLPAEKEVENLGIISQVESLRLEFDELKKKSNTEDVVGYNGGFFIKSRDGNFLLNINGRIQPKYSFVKAEDTDDKHSFALRRAQLVFGGNLYSPKLNYALQISTLASTSLIGADVYYKISDAFTPHFWLDYLFISSGHTLSSGKLQFVNKSLADLRFNFGDSLGFAITGKLGKLKYLTGIYNGIATESRLNANNEMAYSLRLQYDLLNVTKFMGGGDQAHSAVPNLAIGAGAGYGHLEDGAQARVMLGTADMDFKFKGYSLKFAGFFRFTDPSQFSQAQNDTGFTMETGYFFVPKKFELALRVSALIDDLTNAGVNLNMTGLDDVKAASVGSGSPNFWSGSDANADSDNEWEYTVGLNYYFGPGGYNTKIQAQYTFFLDGIAGPDDLTRHIGQLMATVGF